MSKLKSFTYQDIESWKPCYSPSKYLPTDWHGTALDIVKNDEIPWDDRLWVVCREELIDAKTLRLFAVFCARQVEHLLTDECSKNTIDVAERYAQGKAAYAEFRKARAAAWAAAWAAASDTTRAAAWVAAWVAARDAASDAASDAARAAASDAARAAARAAAWAAARDAVSDAASDAARAAAWAAAWAAARASAQEKYKKHLIKLLEGE